MKPATCPRCGVYVLAGQHNGARLTLDITPLGVEGFRAALMAGRPTWALHTSYGGTQAPGPVDPRNPATALGEHGCPARSARPVAVEAPPKALSGPVPLYGPLAVPSRPTAPSGAPLARTWAPAPSSGSAQGSSPSRATPVMNHRSDFLYRRCGKCERIMGNSEPYGVKIGDYWTVVYHDPCPEVNA